MLAEDSTCLSKEDIDSYLDCLISSAHFSFSLNYLKLAINADKLCLAYRLVQNHKREIARQLEASPEQR